MTAMDKSTSVRMAALDFAARLGLPHDMTLKAARAYLAFLEGKEQSGGWSIGEWKPVLATLETAVKDKQTSLNALKTKLATRKRPAPKRRAPHPRG